MRRAPSVEIDEFAEADAGAAIRFASCSSREWLDGWSGGVRAHADALIKRFAA